MLSILGFTGEDIIIMDIKDIPLDKDKDQWETFIDTVLWELKFLDCLHYCLVFKKYPAEWN